MRALAVLLAACLTARAEVYTCPAAAPAAATAEQAAGRPFVDGGRTLIGGRVAAFDGPTVTVTSPIVGEDG